jgi:subtilisin family serine protease
VGSSVHVAVAAGNDGEDAQNTSPARVPAVNTIGAVDINDRLASFSNFGPVVDILAPGVAVRSTWIGSPTVRPYLAFSIVELGLTEWETFAGSEHTFWHIYGDSPRCWPHRLPDQR